MSDDWSEAADALIEWYRDGCGALPHSHPDLALLLIAIDNEIAVMDDAMTKRRE